MAEDKERGLYEKFTVSRTDGQSAPGQKHDGCEYFVLDLSHDPHAIPALLAYAKSCGKDGYKELAVDIFKKIPKTEAERLHVEKLIADLNLSFLK
jgi:hypothetical protein